MRRPLLEEILDSYYHEKKKAKREKRYFIPSQKQIEILKFGDKIYFSDYKHFKMDRANFRRSLVKLEKYNYIRKNKSFFIRTQQGKALAELIR